MPVGPIYNVEDMLQDPHYQARGLFETVNTPQGQLTIPAILPKLSATPGSTDWPGGEVGTHTDELLTELGLSREAIDTLRQAGDV